MWCICPLTMIVGPFFMNHFSYLVDVTPVWKLSSMITVLKAWFHLQGYRHLQHQHKSCLGMISLSVHNQMLFPYKWKCSSLLPAYLLKLHTAQPKWMKKRICFFGGVYVPHNDVPTCQATVTVRNSGLCCCVPCYGPVNAIFVLREL